MKSRLLETAAVLLAASLVVSYAHGQSSDATPPAKKHHVRKAPKPTGPTVEEQIQDLRNQMQSQIDSLKQQLVGKDEQLQEAKQAAAAAQASADKAQQAVDAQQQADTQNATAVSTLQSTVSDLKGNQASLATTISDETSAIKKQIEAPEAVRYKGITLSPAGSFLAAETVWRSSATGGDINTPFTGVPLQNSDAYNLSEFFGSGRQSRIAMRATGKLENMTLTGYYEADFLSAGVTSNNNQSNSYTLRQRQLWADAALSNGWDFSGGQGWSLVTETTQGLTRGTEILPATIDAQYEAGFMWARQYSFRVTKAIDNKLFAGISIENAEVLNAGGAGLPTAVLIGSAGTSGGLYNAGGTAAGGTLANYSFNYTPDFVAKIAAEPGWGHWELFGIARSFRDRIYPAGLTAGTVTPCGVASSTATPCNDVTWGGGVGGGFRGPLATKKVTIGLKGLYGDGVGRYGSSTISDITLRSNGQISPLHAFSALSTVELNPTPRLMVYLNYGGDYVGRDIQYVGTSEVGYGNYNTDMSGCRIEPTSTAGDPTSDPITPGNSTNGCKGVTKDVQEFTAGWWYNIYAGPKGRLRQGLQYSLIRRDLWSGAGGTLNPGGDAHGDDNMVFTSFRYYLP